MAKYTNSFGFHKYHTNSTYADYLSVDTESESLSDIDSGELVYMDGRVPKKLDNTVEGGVAKYLVAEDFDSDNDNYIVVYMLQPIHEITGDYNDALVAGDDVLVHDSQFDEVGTDQDAQGTIVGFVEDEAIVKLK